MLLNMPAGWYENLYSSKLINRQVNYFEGDKSIAGGFRSRGVLAGDNDDHKESNHQADTLLL